MKNSICTLVFMIVSALAGMFLGDHCGFNRGVESEFKRFRAVKIRHEKEAAVEARRYGEIRYVQGYEEAKAKYAPAQTDRKAYGLPPVVKSPPITSVAFQQPPPKSNQQRFTLGYEAPKASPMKQQSSMPYTTSQLIDYSRSLTPQNNNQQVSSGRRGLFRRR